MDRGYHSSSDQALDHAEALTSAVQHLTKFTKSLEAYCKNLEERITQLEENNDDHRGNGWFT